MGKGNLGKDSRRVKKKIKIKLEPGSLVGLPELEDKLRIDCFDFPSNHPTSGCSLIRLVLSI